ncbi:MAG TPA: ATP-binding protein [Candidatus Dormibacteraeota bacterium]|nr:ATP-binding protein [Candidatus Dormibacteraeota bacterium]
MIEIIALIAGTLTTSAIALIVFAKNWRSITNKMFIGLAVGLVGWSVTNYLSLHTSNAHDTLFWIRWIMFFVVTQNTFFFFLVKVFPDYSSNLFRQKRYVVAAIYSIITACVALSPYLFISFKNGAPQPGPGMALFLPHAVIFSIGGIISLINKYRKAQGLKKTQLQYFLAGTVLLFTLVPVSNFIIPVVFKNHALVAISPLYSIIFSGLIAYAIVAQKLFDIRAAVARSVAYLLILGSMALTYGIFIFGVVNIFFQGPSHEFLRQLLSVILVMPLVLSFQSIKKFFDHITNRLFFKDAYDTQDVLDKLGNIAVSEIDLYKILKDTRNVLSQALKSTFIEFVLFRNDKPYVEAHTHKTIPENVLALSPHVKEQHQDLLIVDELNAQNPLHELFISVEGALSLRLKTKEQLVGYIIFGYKKSGDTYSSQDKKLLLIVANELAVAVQNALRFEEIEDFNLTLQAKVDEATRKLRRVNEKLKILDETKDDFISMASHQLRTPLTSIKGYTSMVLEGDAGTLNETQRKLLGQAFFSSQRMVYLIADLLNVSRLRTGKFIILAAPTNLAEVVEQEVGQLIETAHAKQLTFTYQKPEDFPDLMLDETKIRQVIMNFADNSIYYTPAGGHIDVKLIDKPSTIELRVEDDGIGVPKNEHHHLFTKFYRAGNARKARPDGTGLGLFMAKKVVLAQGGSIIFESQEGKGSTFGFIFSKSKLKVTKPPVKAVPSPARETVKV